MAFLPNCSEIPNSCMFLQLVLFIYVTDVFAYISLAGLE